METFLSEMGVMRKHIGDASLSHDIHRDAVVEAVGFIGTRFVKRQTVQECLTGFGYDFHLLITENRADCQSDLAPHDLPIFRKEVRRLC